MSEPKINYLGPASEAAISTLQHMGYMYNGGQQWKPPIGTKPDFDLIDRLRAERDALQLRLNEADQRIDELTHGHGEHVALMSVERSYDVRAQQILAFNTSKQGGGDLDDALGAAYKAALRYTPHPGQVPATVASRDDSIAWLKRIDGIGQNRAELIYSMGFRRHTEPDE